MRLVAILTVLTLVCGFAAAEDKLILKDGQVVTGRILSETESDIQVDSGEETIRVPLWAIEKIERDENAAGEPRSAGRFEATPELLAWIETCAAKLASDDAGVRATAGSALRAAGEAARPALEKAAAGDNANAAKAAKAVLGASKRRAAARPEGRRGGQRAAATGVRSASSLVIDLGLSSEQSPQFEEIFGGQQEKKLSIAADVRSGTLPRDEAISQIRALHEETEASLASVLTEEQLERYKEMVPKPPAPSREGEER